MLEIPGKWTDAIEDPRLYGGVFITPFQSSACLFKQTFSYSASTDSRRFDMFKRALICAPSAIAAVLTAPVAALGMVEAAERLETQIIPEHFRANDAFTQIAIDQTKTLHASGEEEIYTTHYTMPTVLELPQFFYRWFHYNFN